MRARHIILILFSVAALGAGGLGFSQNSADRRVGGSDSTDQPKPTNLKALPKESSGKDVDKLMHRYEQDLGVPCGYCHDENAETKKINYASDENPVKETARFMIRMTNDLNVKYLSQLGDRRYAEPLTCGNCHQGQVDPPSFEPKTTK